MRIGDHRWRDREQPSRWTATALGRRRRDDKGLRADVLGHEVGMLARETARALDLDHHGIMQRAIEQCRGHDPVTEHLVIMIGGKSFRRGWTRASQRSIIWRALSRRCRRSATCTAAGAPSVVPRAYSVERSRATSRIYGWRRSHAA